MKNQADKLREMALSVRQQIESEMYKEANHTRVIVISSGKGGTGKSTIALNLSLTLVLKGQKVVLMDADMGLANIDIMLGIVPKYNLYHMIQGKKTIQDITITEPAGLDIIPGGSGINELANLGKDELKKILVELGKLDGKYDFMIIDTGAGISDSVITFLLAADDVIIITTPEPTSITDAYGIVKSLTKKEFSGNLLLIVNRVRDKTEGMLVAEKFKLVCKKFLDLNIKTLGYIVNEPMVEEGIRRQQSFVQLFPRSLAARNIGDIADQLLDNEREDYDNYKTKNGGIKNFFKRLTGISKTS